MLAAFNGLILLICYFTGWLLPVLRYRFDWEVVTLAHLISFSSLLLSFHINLSYLIYVSISHPSSPSRLSGDDAGEDLVMLPEVKRKLEEGTVLHFAVQWCAVL